MNTWTFLKTRKWQSESTDLLAGLGAGNILGMTMKALVNFSENLHSNFYGKFSQNSKFSE